MCQAHAPFPGVFVPVPAGRRQGFPLAVARPQTFPGAGGRDLGVALVLFTFRLGAFARRGLLAVSATPQGYRTQLNAAHKKFLSKYAGDSALTSRKSPTQAHRKPEERPAPRPQP